MQTVELLYLADCPNVDAARERLRRASEEVGAPPSWTEVDVGANDAPAHARGYGAPTTLVGGRDVTGAAPGGGSCCRVCKDPRAVPPVDAIVAAPRAALNARA
jgi:hypothetical protein